MSLLNITHIMNLLTHRYPFLLVDSVEKYNKGEILCKKNTSINELYFQGHFPNEPVVPGVLLVESGAQAAAILCMLDDLNISNLKDFDKNAEKYYKEIANSVGYLATIKNFKFKKKATPGDVLNITCTRKLAMGKLSEFDLKIFNDRNQLICGGQIVASRQ